MTYKINYIGCFSPGVLEWPTISEVEILSRHTFLDKHIIRWKIENYTEFLTLTFTKDDGTVINPNKDGYTTWRPTCDFSAVCVQLKLPYFFSGKVKLNVSFNASVTVSDAEIRSAESPSVSPLSKCFTSMYVLFPSSLCL